MSKRVTFGAGGYDPTQPNDNIVDVVEVSDVQVPLDTLGVIATLNAVLGVWTLEQAAAAVQLAPADLIHEAQAWYVAAHG